MCLSPGSPPVGKPVSSTALQVASDALAGFESALETFPIDLDPRIVALEAGRAFAEIALNAVRGKLEGMPRLPQI